MKTDHTASGLPASQPPPRLEKAANLPAAAFDQMVAGTLDQLGQQNTPSPAPQPQGKAPAK